MSKELFNPFIAGIVDTLRKRGEDQGDGATINCADVLAEWAEGKVCNNCSNGATIEYLPGRDDTGPEVWCFGCFTENYCGVGVEVVIVPEVRERRQHQLNVDFHDGVPS